MSFADAAQGTLQGGGQAGLGRSLVDSAGLQNQNPTSASDIMRAMGRDAEQNAAGMVKTPQMLTGMPAITPLATTSEYRPFSSRPRGYGV